MASRHRYSNDDLAEAVANSVSIAGVLRHLGIRVSGGSHYYLSRRIRALGLDTSHFTGQGHNRGKAQPRLPPESFLVRKPAGSNRTGAKYLRRALVESGRDYRCEMCGQTDDWFGAPLVLHVDHIDGEALNCQPENLRFLCPNCHSQTPSYCRTFTARERRKPAA
jgi:hypothetical protein